MSAGNGSTAGLPDAAATSAAAVRARAMSRPVMPTRAPIAARSAAVALPIPLVPAVTRTVWPAIGPVLMPAIADSFTLRAAGFLVVGGLLAVPGRLPRRVIDDAAICGNVSERPRQVTERDIAEIIGNRGGTKREPGQGRSSSHCRSLPAA